MPLTLTLQVGESVEVTGPYTVTFVGHSDGSIRLAFDAPPEVTILRVRARRRQRPEDEAR